MFKNIRCKFTVARRFYGVWLGFAVLYRVCADLKRVSSGLHEGYRR